MNKKGVSWIWYLITIILLIVGVFILIAANGEKSPVAQREVVKEFELKVGEETPTIDVGPGTRHLLCANKLYQAVSVQKDGSRRIYDMPTRETWTGGEPAGKLRLIGKEKGTVVKISSLR